MYLCVYTGLHMLIILVLTESLCFFIFHMHVHLFTCTREPLFMQLAIAHQFQINGTNTDSTGKCVATCMITNKQLI